MAPPSVHFHSQGGRLRKCAFGVACRKETFIAETTNDKSRVKLISREESEAQPRGGKRARLSRDESEAQPRESNRAIGSRESKEAPPRGREAQPQIDRLEKKTEREIDALTRCIEELERSNKTTERKLRNSKRNSEATDEKPKSLTKRWKNA